MSRCLLLGAAGTTLVVSILAQAQIPATTAARLSPATTPWPATSAATTTAAARRTVTVPPGFKLVIMQGRQVFCEEEDVESVRIALLTMPPTSRPSTMPADLVEMLSAQRDTLIRQITADLALGDRTPIASAVDQQLIAPARRFSQMKVPVFFIACTHQKLNALVLSGWGSDYFSYNRAAETVMAETSVTLSADRPMDDILLPVVFNPEDSLEEKSAALARTINSNESGIVKEIAGRAMLTMQLGLAQIITQNAIDPLKLRPDQDWWGFGVTGYLSAKYICSITGASLDHLIKVMIFEPPDAPVRGALIDLAHPADVTSLREEIVPFYADALRRRGTEIVYSWIQKAGPSAIPHMLTALRQGLPPDGPGLVHLIHKSSGVDLSAQVAPQPLEPEP